MSNELNFDLPQPPAEKTTPPKTLTILLLLILALQVVLGICWIAQSHRNAETGNKAGLEIEQLRELAMKFEKRGLNDAAEQTWVEYLGKQEPDAERSAKIWYRIGTVHQSEREFAKALACYYRSESYATIADMKQELGRRVQTCLEALGKFAALRYELAERVGATTADRQTGSETLAEIGTQKITRADLDKIIEGTIARQLGQYAAFLPEDKLNEQKQMLIKRFNEDQARRQVLEQYLGQELLYRKALEEKLAEQPEIRDLLHEANRSLLAQQAMSRELARRIQITPKDVEMFYEANKDDFKTPASAKVRVIVQTDREKAGAVLNTLKNQPDFAKLARELSTEKATAEKGGALPAEVRQNSDYIPGMGRSPELAEAIASCAVGQIGDAPIQTEKGWVVFQVESRIPAKQKSFQEAAEEAGRKLRQSKEDEVQKSLFEELRKKYDVVLHGKQFPDPEKSAMPPAQK